ncbi:MAG: hypothetical protein K2G55_11470, partial [Lachnospiraceae bacterium]|nr:hypothetical protein [Lachnospiraceae bacterium]
ANAFVDDVRDAIESGMNAHIAKPIQIDTLKATIQQVLDSRNPCHEGQSKAVQQSSQQLAMETGI